MEPREPKEAKEPKMLKQIVHETIERRTYELVPEDEVVEDGAAEMGEDEEDSGGSGGNLGRRRGR